MVIDSHLKSETETLQSQVDLFPPVSSSDLGRKLDRALEWNERLKSALAFYWKDVEESDPMLVEQTLRKIRYLN